VSFHREASSPRPGARPPAQCGAMRVLVVEDEPKMAALIKRVLVAERHVVDLAPDGVSAIALAETAPYDVVVLDRGLPDIDGITVMRLLRAKAIATPVLLLTALGSVDDRVAGLDAGADDYLIKPFSFDELLARVRALVRRTVTDRPTILRVGDLTLDPATRRVTRGSTAIRLTRKELALLEYFMRNPGQVLTRSRLIEHVWDFAFEGDSNVVDVYVLYLRQKIDRPFGSNSIETVRGVGYRLLEGSHNASPHQS